MKEGFGLYLLKRLFLGLITLLVILFASYALMRLAPGDPTKSSMLGEGAGTQLASDRDALVQNQSLREKLYLDKPLAYGFFMWLSGVVRGDLGESAAVDKGQPVLNLILEKLPVTLRLNIFAILLTYLLAIPLGIFSAVRPDTRTDQTITFILFFLYSLPVLWSALMLQALFCKGGWCPIFPLKGITPDILPGMSTWTILGKTALHYILPVFCLSYAGFAGLTRFTRAGMLEVIHQDYIRTARAKGVKNTKVIFKHALKNTLTPVITYAGPMMAYILTGSMVVDNIFSVPGLGRLFTNSMLRTDYMMIMGVTIFLATMIILMNFIGDILYKVVDPRIDLT